MADPSGARGGNMPADPMVEAMEEVVAPVEQHLKWKKADEESDAALSAPLMSSIQQVDSTGETMDSAATPTPVEKEFRSSEISDVRDIPSWSREHVNEGSDFAEGQPSPAPVRGGHLMKEAEEFKIDFDERKAQMHRFPASLRNIGSQYIVPRVVAIGPYHHGLHHLQEMERVKHVAATQFIRESGGRSVEEIYHAVHQVSGVARHLYGQDSRVAGISDDDFVPMMFFDACFLLEFMHYISDEQPLSDEALLYVFRSNQELIISDVLLLENQLPWLVVETLMKFRSVPVQEKMIISRMGKGLTIRRHHIHTGPEEIISSMDDNYKPPHLLGLLRFYKASNKMATKANKNEVFSTLNRLKARLIGAQKEMDVPSDNNMSMETLSQLSISPGAIDLAEIGIKLKAIKTGSPTEMDIRKGPLFGDISFTPLMLNVSNACLFANMAAFEVCTASWDLCDVQEMVVCSYLALLGMLMDQKEDVRDLRRKHLVQGELTNREVFDFFKILTRNLPVGHSFLLLLTSIEKYQANRRIWVKGHKFIYNNFKTISAVLSVVGVLVGIFKTLLSLKQHQ